MNVYSEPTTAVSDKPTLPEPTSTLAQGLGVTEVILRNRVQFFGEIREGMGLNQKIRAMLITTASFAALYGAVMGSSSTLLQALSSAVKLPLLLIITSLICLPTLYFFNVLFGSHLNLKQYVALSLTPITILAILLFSFAPITLFFLLTTSDYQFFKLLNVLFFGIAGVAGMGFLWRGMQIANEGNTDGVKARRRTLILWTIVYGFVGSQMAWTLRPFMGYPGGQFEIVRQLGGNFYADVLVSLGEILGFFIVG